MSAAVWKFPLVITDTQRIKMPKGSDVLSVAIQGDELCMWALVDPSEEETIERTIGIVGTGHKREDLSEVDFVGFIDTVLLHGGGLVFHVFDLGIRP